ncbi:MAG TPA: dihydrofolate reductase family protein [bacterium]|nr:dihydrofolate reductase family protein [bacterium]
MKLILMMAITADGKIAKTATQLADWTSKADKKIFVEETKSAGVIIMGKTTYETISKPLPGRLNIILDKNPNTSQNIPNSLEYTNLTPKELLNSLADRGFEKVILGGGATINGLFLKENLVDEIWLTIEPKIFGEGLSLFKDADVDLKLELLEVRNLDKDVIQVRYKVIK